MARSRPPVSGWVWTTAGAYQVVFRNDYVNHSSNRYGIRFHIRPDGTLVGAIFEGFALQSNTVLKISNNPVLSDQAWHHYAVVYNAIDNIQLYFDGQEVGGYYSGTGSGLTYSSGNGALGMEYTHVVDGSQYFLEGGLDDLRVYDRGLSEEEILFLFNEPVFLQFDSATYVVDESTSTANINVTRTGGSYGPVSVVCTSSDGTAIAGSDYSSPSNTLNWGNGDVAAKTFTIAIIDDDSVESDETVDLYLSNPAGGAILGTINTAVLTITDNDSVTSSGSGGGGGGCNTSGPAPGEPFWPEIMWIVILAVIVLMRRRVNSH